MLRTPTRTCIPGHLINLDDLHDKIGRRAGGYTNTIVGRGRDGHYRALALVLHYGPLGLAYRPDRGNRLKTSRTPGEDVHRIGKKLKAKGHPVGFPMSHGADANGSMRAIIWSWGGKLVEDDSKTVAFNSRETVEALKFIKALYQDCMSAGDSRLGRPKQQRMPELRQVAA